MRFQLVCFGYIKQHIPTLIELGFKFNDINEIVSSPIIEISSLEEIISFSKRYGNIVIKVHDAEQYGLTNIFRMEIFPEFAEG